MENYKITISELISHLNHLKEKHGDLQVCFRESDEYWGSIDSSLIKDNIFFDINANPNGPKKASSEAIIISTNY